MQAFAPRWTRARTWALQMVPLPPVQKTTLLSGKFVSQREGRWAAQIVRLPKMPFFQTSLRYSDLGRGIVRGEYVVVGVGVEAEELVLR